VRISCEMYPQIIFPRSASRIGGESVSLLGAAANLSGPLLGYELGITIARG
jgi:hypothetical protein